MAKDKATRPKTRKLHKLPPRKRRAMLLKPRSERLAARSKRWLETHIWHAKRMHMVELWGHRLADRPTAKGFRASHRAATHGTLLHDASYTTFLLLEGSLPLLEATLARVCDPVDVSPSSARYRDGSRACSINVYHDSTYPHALIGPVEIIWRAKSDSDIRQLLVSCHPSIAALVRGQLDAVMHDAAQSQQPALGFRLRSLQLCAFKLTGPTSSEALRRVLQSAVDKQRLRTALDAAPAAQPKGLIVGAVVDDPRLRSPAKHKPGSSSISSEPSSDRATCDAFWSCIDRLWQPKYRKVELDQRRRVENLLPGTPLQIRPDDDRIPLLMMARDDTWTVITPAGTGMMFWPSLVSVAPRVGGQRECIQRSFESRRPAFPRDWPTTQAGDARREGEAQAAEERWSKKMPAQRVNFEAVGTSSPWRPQWTSIVEGEPWLLAGGALSKATTLESLEQTITQARIERGLPAIENLRLENALVSVRLDAEGRGTPETYSTVFDDGPIGFVTTGRFSLAAGSGRATAIVTLKSWLAGSRDVHYKNQTATTLYNGRLQSLR